MNPRHPPELNQAQALEAELAERIAEGESPLAILATVAHTLQVLTRIGDGADDTVRAKLNDRRAALRAALANRTAWATATPAQNSPEEPIFSIDDVVLVGRQDEPRESGPAQPRRSPHHEDGAATDSPDKRRD